MSRLMLKKCPSCRSKDVHREQQGAIEIFHIVCSMCGMRGPIEDSPELADKAWNDLPRHPVPLDLPASVYILNRNRHMSSDQWKETTKYGEPMATNGLSNLTELEARGIAREYLLLRQDQKSTTKSTPHY